MHNSDQTLFELYKAAHYFSHPLKGCSLAIRPKREVKFSSPNCTFETTGGLGEVELEMADEHTCLPCSQGRTLLFTSTKGLLSSHQAKKRGEVFITKLHHISILPPAMNSKGASKQSEVCQLVTMLQLDSTKRESYVRARRPSFEPHLKSSVEK